MSIFRCRACYSDCIEKIFQFEGFPRAAQFFLENPESFDKETITLDVVRCKSCSLVQITNEPVSYFREVITAASLNEESKKILEIEWKDIISSNRINGADALEVGSGRGDFLEVLKRLGFKSTGLEHGLSNVSITEKKGLSVIHGYLLEHNFCKKYQVIACNNYLEHQPDVGAFIDRFYDLLDDEGLIYVSVPNLAYLLDKSCLYEFVADHLVYFTDVSLRQLFENKGFKVSVQYKKNNGNDLVIVAQKLAKINYQNIEKEALNIIKSVKNIAQEYAKKGKKIGVWGAGHRALALMTLANLDEIEYVVDSADFKQGKYTPVLHKKIISPEDFYELKCDALILMLPGNFNDQVAELLKQKDINCELIFFKDSVI